MTVSRKKGAFRTKVDLLKKIMQLSQQDSVKERNPSPQGSFRRTRLQHDTEVKNLMFLKLDAFYVKSWDTLQKTAGQRSEENSEESIMLLLL